MKSRIGLLLILSGLALAGCDAPPNSTPVLPPGMEPVRVPSPSAGSGSEALGEGQGHAHGPAESGISTVISEPTPIGEIRKAASGLTYTTLKAGDGPTVKPGQSIKVHYTGRLVDGTKFDSSIDRGAPFPVVIGTGQVIKGWDLGIPGMKVGEKRRLVIPSDLGYGTKGFPPTIPANAQLNFEVEVIEAK